MRSKLLLATILCLFTSLVFAQNATLRGFVYNKETGEPVIFTNVFFDGTNYGAATDVNGYFSISKVPAGSYKLSISAIGFEKYTEAVTLEEDRIINKNIYIEESGIELSTFEVSSERKEAKTQVKTAVTKITPKEIKNLPSVGGEPDLAQYIQVLPGVVFTGDQGGQLYIRGGSPIQNRVLLDGMTVYSPFHSIGLFSVFDSEIIRNADVYSGGFPAQYGGRVSSIMDIRTIDGNKKEIKGKVGATPFGAKVMLNGPMKKLQENGSASSFIFSAKTSYLDQTSKYLYSYINEDGLPFRYTDLYGKLSFSGGNGSRFNLFGFNFTDEVNYLGLSKLSWTNQGAGANFVLVPSSNPVLIEGYIALSDYSISLEEDNVNRTRESGISGFDFGFDFKNFQGENEFRYGIAVNGYKTYYNFFNSFDANFNISDNTTEMSGYLDYKYANGLLVINPGFRAHYYASLSEMSLEPRLGLKYNLSEFIRLKASAGIFSQNLVAGNSDRDVVNLFYGYISTPDNLPNSFILEDGTVKDNISGLQKSQHLVTGVEYDVSDKIQINVEGYIKRFSQLTNINRNKVYEDTPENREIEDIYKKDFIIETGDARGLDFTLKYNNENWYLWAVYSLSKVDRWDGIRQYSPVFDRRHNVNLVGTYKFGEDKTWEVNARWNFGSGLPFTLNAGFYETPDFSDGSSTDITETNGELTYRLGEINGGRLTSYHRLDVSASKKWKFEKGLLEANVGVTNFYNRENIFYVDRVTFEQIKQLPFLPSFGVSYSF